MVKRDKEGGELGGMRVRDGNDGDLERVVSDEFECRFVDVKSE